MSPRRSKRTRPVSPRLEVGAEQRVEHARARAVRARDRVEQHAGRLGGVDGARLDLDPGQAWPRTASTNRRPRAPRLSLIEAAHAQVGALGRGSRLADEERRRREAVAEQDLACPGRRASPDVAQDGRAVRVEEAAEEDGVGPGRAPPRPRAAGSPALRVPSCAGRRPRRRARARCARSGRRARARTAGRRRRGRRRVDAAEVDAPAPRARRPGGRPSGRRARSVAGRSDRASASSPGGAPGAGRVSPTYELSGDTIASGPPVRAGELRQRGHRAGRVERAHHADDAPVGARRRARWRRTWPDRTARCARPSRRTTGCRRARRPPGSRVSVSTNAAACAICCAESRTPPCSGRSVTIRRSGPAAAAVERRLAVPWTGAPPSATAAGVGVAGHRHPDAVVAGRDRARRAAEPDGPRDAVGLRIDARQRAAQRVDGPQRAGAEREVADARRRRRSCASRAAARAGRARPCRRPERSPTRRRRRPRATRPPTPRRDRARRCGS